MPEGRSPLAASVAGLSRPKDEACGVCGRPHNLGKHYVRATAGELCGVDGCKKKLFEKCLMDGKVVGRRCLYGHRGPTDG